MAASRPPRIFDPRSARFRFVRASVSMQKASAASGNDGMAARRLLHRVESRAIVLGVATRAAGEGLRLRGSTAPVGRRHAGGTVTRRVCEAREEPAALAAIAGDGTKQRAPCVEPCPYGRLAPSAPVAFPWSGSTH